MDYQSEPVTMWFDRRVVMRRSPIHGTGVFATHPIRAGEQLMWVTGGIVYSSEDWRSGRVQLDGEQYNESQIADDLFVTTPKSLYYYVNHACDPAMLNFVAFRDIAAGEEITTDYAYCEAAPDYLLGPMPLRLISLPRARDRQRLEAPRPPAALPRLLHAAHRAANSSVRGVAS